MSNELMNKENTKKMNVIDKGMDILKENPEALPNVLDAVNGLIALSDAALEHMTDAALEAYKIDAQVYINEISIKIDAQTHTLDNYHEALMRAMDYADKHSDNPNIVEMFEKILDKMEMYDKGLQQIAETESKRPGLIEKISGIISILKK